ncbi:MAG: serine/threonine-protein kinase [Myxococcota bacterium]
MSGTEATPYRVVRPIAKGGMGRVDMVVRAEGAFRRVYAMKRLRAAYLDEKDVRAMFIDEGRIAGLIRHPHVVGVIDVGEDAEGPFMVMDYIEGITARRLIRWSTQAEHPLPAQVCARIVQHAALGLHAAHELRGEDGKPLQLVHRDVSPQNVIIGYDGLARVVDFGVARAMGRTTRTSTGVLKGKIGYMAPEQLRFKKPDRRADLFALGVVFWELLAGRRLYSDGEMGDVAQEILQGAPPDIDEVRTDVHPSIVQLLFELLAKAPDDRPASAGEVASRLEAIVADLASTEGTIGLADFLSLHFAEEREEQTREVTAALSAANRPATRPTRENTSTPSVARWWLLALAAAVVASGLVVWFVWSPEPSIPEPVPLSEPAPVMAADESDAPSGPEDEVAIPEIATEDPPAPRRGPRRRIREARRVATMTLPMTASMEPPATPRAPRERASMLREFGQAL